MALVISISFLAACHSALPGDGGPVGNATARITQVPDGVACVAISVDGTHSVMNAFDVVPGQPAFMQMSNLPVGLDAFNAAAFAMPCASINGAQPAWATAQPFYAAVEQGKVTALTLTLQPTGGAVIGIDFGDGGGAPPDLSGPYDGGVPNCPDMNCGDMAYPIVDLAAPPFDGGKGPVDLAYQPRG
jgi:hypothetical protein